MKKLPGGLLSQSLLLPAAVLGLWIGQADAKLTLDLRASSATAGASIPDAKHVSLFGSEALGSVITFQLYAVVTGAEGNAVSDEKFQSCLATLMTFSSGAKNIHGALSTVQLDPIFRQGIWSGGVVRDLNGDGDLDVGGPAPVGIMDVAGSYIDPHHSGSPLGSVPGVSTDLPGSTAGREWLLGTTTLTIGGIDDLEGASILANFFVPIFDLNSAPNLASQGTTIGPGYVNLLNNSRMIIHEDGLYKSGGTAGAPNVFAGGAVTISVTPGAPSGSVPEPSALAMALAGMSVLFGARRRR